MSLLNKIFLINTKKRNSSKTTTLYKYLTNYFKRPGRAA